MMFLGKAVLLLSLWSSVGQAMALPGAVAEPKLQLRSAEGNNNNQLVKRVNCRGRGNIVVYEHSNGAGGEFMICLNVYLVSTCTILLSTTGILQQLASKVSDWVSSKVTDASAAGPQHTRRDEDGAPSLPTWGELYNHTKSLNAASEVSIHDSHAPLAATAAADDAMSIHKLDIHEDGFSASASLDSIDDTTPATKLRAKKRSSCYRQVHVHYWASAGHQATVLSNSDIYTLTYNGALYSYQHDLWKACYEMTNNGGWDGYYRICINDNISQVGCYTCGGHNN